MGKKKDGRELKQDISSRSKGDCFSFYISVFYKFSIISLWLLSPAKVLKKRKKARKQAAQDFGLLSHELLAFDLLLQVEAGKGLEMRKLVLSGFLASEEIYINQLEALLLVSVYSGAFVL